MSDQEFIEKWPQYERCVTALRRLEAAGERPTCERIIELSGTFGAKGTWAFLQQWKRR